MTKLEYVIKTRGMSTNKRRHYPKNVVPVPIIPDLKNDLEETIFSEWSSIARSLKTSAKDLHVKQSGNCLVPSERASI